MCVDNERKGMIRMNPSFCPEHVTGGPINSNVAVTNYVTQLIAHGG